MAIRAAIVFGGAALVVALIVGALELTGQGNQTLTTIGITYDFEPKAGTHGGTAASVVKSDASAFDIGGSAAISQVVDRPALACYLVKSDTSGATISLIEIDGTSAGSLGGASRWTGNHWEAGPARARAAQCEAMVPKP